MDPSLRAYLSQLGRRGGLKSRRTLSPEQARTLVRIREAGRAYRRFHTQCFWSFDPNLRITQADVPWVAERLMTFGGSEGLELGAKLLRLEPVSPSANENSPIADMSVLHPIDLAINKVLALVGRDEPRDYLDTIDAHTRILGLGGLVWAACGKDPGFTPLMLLDLLRRKGRYRPEDFTRLALREAPDLPAAKQAWQSALESATEFVASRPIEEVGCLYYSRAPAAFVATLPLPSDAVPHFGRPGGVLPLVG